MTDRELQEIREWLEQPLEIWRSVMDDFAMGRIVITRLLDEIERLKIAAEDKKLKSFVKAARMKQDCPFTTRTQESGAHTIDG